MYSYISIKKNIIVLLKKYKFQGEKHKKTSYTRLNLVTQEVLCVTDTDNTDMEIKSLSPYRYYFGQKIPAELITKKLVTLVLADRTDLAKGPPY